MRSARRTFSTGTRLQGSSWTKHRESTSRTFTCSIPDVVIGAFRTGDWKGVCHFWTLRLLRRTGNCLRNGDDHNTKGLRSGGCARPSTG